MLIVLPTGGLRRGAWRRVGVSLSLLLAVLIVRLLEQLLPVLPVSWMPLLSSMAGWRLYSDPELQLFSWYQLWSHVLLHHGWFSALVGMLAWWAIAPLVEMRLGSLLFAMILATVVPLGASIYVLFGEGSPDMGLLLPVMAAAGLLVSFEAAQRSPWLLAWWLLSMVGVWRFALPILAIVIAYVVADLGHLLLAGLVELGDLQRFLPLYLVVVLSVFVGGQLAARLVQMLPTEETPRPH